MNVVEKAPQGPQEWLDQLVKTSADGGFPARDEGGHQCMYRTTDGRACAVGQLIPDDKYDPLMDSRYGSVSGRFWEKFSHVFPDWAQKQWQLSSVQEVHDRLARETDIDAKWPHERFVEQLLQCNIFQGLTPTAA